MAIAITPTLHIHTHTKLGLGVFVQAVCLSLFSVSQSRRCGNALLQFNIVKSILSVDTGTSPPNIQSPAFGLVNHSTNHSTSQMATATVMKARYLEHIQEYNIKGVGNVAG